MDELNNFNISDHNYENEEYNDIKRITIPADKIKDFITLLYGTNEIIIKRNLTANYLDLTNRSVIVL
jgi:hypothetical protein